MLTTFKDISDLLKKVISIDESRVYGYDIETGAQSYQWKRMEEAKQKKYVKFDQMWRFWSLFSSIIVAWFIMNCCYKIVRSKIRNTTTKLCADCAKQFFRNAQNFEKTNYGFCILITHPFTHKHVMAKNKTVNMSQLPYSPDLVPADLLLLKLMIPMKGKRFATIEEIK